MESAQPLDDSFYKALAELDAVVGVLQGAAAQMPETAEGQDSSGAVSIVVTNRGSIVDLSISQSWRDEIEPARLGASINEALANAHEGLLAGAEEFAALHADDIEDVDVAAVKKRADDRAHELLSAASFVVPGNPDEVVEEVLQKADSLERLTRGIESLATDEADDELPTSADPIVVKRAGGQVIEVLIDPYWAKNSPTALVIERLQQAVVSDVPPSSELPEADDDDMLILRLLSTMKSLS